MYFLKTMVPHKDIFFLGSGAHFRRQMELQAQVCGDDGKVLNPLCPSH